MKKILFVCTGNTCRSSMAEAIAKEVLQKFGKSEYQILSAGTGTIAGESASKNAILALQEKGIDLSTHKSSVLTKELIDQSDIILTMTSNHKQRILDIVPEAKEKVFLLKEFSRSPQEIQALKSKAEELYQKINDKKQIFLAKHSLYIKELEQERIQLTTRIREINEELVRLEDELKVFAHEEIEHLQNIEADLGNLEILDPFAQPIEVYRCCRDELIDAIEKIVNNI